MVYYTTSVLVGKYNPLLEEESYSRKDKTFTGISKVNCLVIRIRIL